MTRVLLALLVGLAFSAVAGSQEIYRWVDKDGVVHYADQPGAPDAKRIEYIGVRPDVEGADSVSAAPSTGSATPSPAPAEYRALAVTSPAPEESFFGTDTVVRVELDLDPPLGDGDRIAVFLDGKRVTDSLLEPSTELSNLVRGTHFVRAAVLNAAGESLITSAPVTFHVRHPSIARPPVGPALRPPPRARP